MGKQSKKNGKKSATTPQLKKKEDSNGRDIGMSVDGFRTQLRREVETVCRDLGTNYDKEQDRGFAFEVWAAELLLRIEGTDADPADVVYKTNDLKVDIAFEEEDGKVLVLAQTKFVSIASNPDVPETEVHDFFKRHEIFLDQDKWLAEHASEQLHDLLVDYRDRLKNGWAIKYYFLTTGSASDRVKELVQALDKSVKTKAENVSFELYDFYGLKELYTRTRSLEATIAQFVDIQFPEKAMVTKDQPHRTLVSIVKGNTLVNLYRKEKDSLFAYNIRSFLGKRVNRELVETAKSRPSEFYYFNNGVSAICTRIEHKRDNEFRFHDFQIINGAQTVGSLHAVRDLSPECEVLLRITEGASVKTEKGFNADIIRYNNTQNVVKASDFRSNDKIQYWLEDKLKATRARGAIRSPLAYVRKRSFHRTRAATAIKFEDFAKIRFAFLYEPTKCVGDPRSLWTLKEDGGSYESAFGVNGELVEFWSDSEVELALFSIIVFLEVMQRTKALIKKDKEEFFFLLRLRFWAVSLARAHVDTKQLGVSDLLESDAVFKKWFDQFWKLAIQVFVTAHDNASNDDISTFALVRNETRWQQTRRSFVTLLKAGILDTAA
jgi:hypothetical protein